LQFSSFTSRMVSHASIFLLDFVESRIRMALSRSSCGWLLATASLLQYVFVFLTCGSLSIIFRVQLSACK
jgi:hypothetical protein